MERERSERDDVAEADDKVVRKPTSRSPFVGRPPYSVAYRTKLGRMYQGKSDEILKERYFDSLRGKVNLVFTSPPFALNRKKHYGNEVGDEYISWLSKFGPLLKEMLAPNGSIVIELGNAWESGSPVMSTLPMRALLDFQTKNQLHLCQEFIWFNPAKLPSPAQWVNVDRIRVKDSFTRLWWMSTTARPKADNRRVLRQYSDSMKKLLETKKYNSGVRPSQHNIGRKSFLTDHGGAIPPNVLTMPNTHALDPYLAYCKQHNYKLHPARMPLALAEFFIQLLTEPGDLVLDPFGGSNTTGAAAENCGRYWLSIEASADYIWGSRGRFNKIML